MLLVHQSSCFRFPASRRPCLPVMHVIESRAIHKPRRVSHLTGTNNFGLDRLFSTPKNMEQITTSLAVRTAQKSTVSGSGSDAAGSVTKRFLPFLSFERNVLISHLGRLSNELMTLMVSVLYTVSLASGIPHKYFQMSSSPGIVRAKFLAQRCLV
jgi:hypothetical protein